MPDQDLYSVTLGRGDHLTVAATALGAAATCSLSCSTRPATSWPAGCRTRQCQLITNGSFETGDFTGWTVATTARAGPGLAVSGAGAGNGFGLAPTEPQDGDFVAWNGFDSFSAPMQYTMFQDVAIPADAPAAQLSWQDRVQWNFTLGGVASEPRIYEVQVRDPATNAVLETLFSFSTDTQAVNPTGDTGWQTHDGRPVGLHRLDGPAVLPGVRPPVRRGPGPGRDRRGQPADRTADFVVPTNVDDLISNFVAPPRAPITSASPATPGTDYSLVTTRNADFSVEANNTIATAQPVLAPEVAGRQWVLGYVERNAVEGAITFDELPLQPLDGVSLEGVTFDFKLGGVDSTSATFGSTGPGTTQFLAAPLADGAAAGILTLDFAAPVTELEFGVALSTFSTVPDAVVVQLFDAGGGLVDTISVTTTSLVSFSEALFQYSGAPFSRAVLDFNEAFAGAFAIDNLVFRSARGGRPGRLPDRGRRQHDAGDRDLYAGDRGGQVPQRPGSEDRAV